MRIENNDNVGFGAYFKNNTYFKQLYSSTGISLDKKLLDTFTKELPNHEIEIISEQRDPFRPISVFTLFNNNTGGSLKVYLKDKMKALNECLEECVNTPVNGWNDFWGNHIVNNSLEDNYKALTNHDR